MRSTTPLILARKSLALVFFFLIATLTSFAQFCDNVNPTLPTPASSPDCGVTINYAPIVPGHTPIKYIRIAIHSFQKDDGTGNFQNLPADIAYLNGVIANFNAYHTNLDPPTHGTSPYIVDSRMRFSLADMYYHPHTVDWDWTTFSSERQWANDMYIKYVVNDFDGYGMTAEQKYSTFHIFLQGNTPSGIIAGEAFGFGFKNWIREKAWYEKFLVDPSNTYVPGGNLRHEFGHTTDLYHNFVGQCDDCPDNDCPSVGTSNNFMDGPFPQTSLSECQLGKIHYCLIGKVGDISDCVIRDYCNRDASATIIITTGQNVVWNSEKNLRGDVVVQAGAILTIKCRINFPQDAKLIVEPQGQLIIDDGLLTTSDDCSGIMWHGVEVWGDITKSQYLTGGIQYQGKLVMKNNATIQNAWEGVNTIKRFPDNSVDWATTGGIVFADNSHFINCRTAVGLLPYQNFHPTLGTPKNDLCYFKNCEFKTTGQLNRLDAIPQGFVILLDVKGVRLLGNTYSNFALPTENMGNRGNGIVTFDAQFYVNSFCNSVPPIIPCPAANTVKNVFSNLNYGVYAAAGTSSLRTFTVDNADFQNNTFGVYSKGVSYATVTNNNFDVGALIPSYGVYMDRSIGFKLENNILNSTHNGLAGTYINNCNQDATAVYNNYYSNLFAGNIAAYDNFDDSDLTGLRITCNDFLTSSNLYDVAVLPQTPSAPVANRSRIHPIQGICTSDPKTLVRNYYSAPCSTVENQYYVDITPVGPIYHHNSTEAQALPACKDPIVLTLPSGCGSIVRDRNAHCPPSTGVSHSSAKSAIVGLETEITAGELLLEAGADPALIDAINSNMSEGDKKNLLLSKSPYLSDEVLIAYIPQADPPPAGLLEQVISANSPVTQEVRDALELIPLPQGIRNQINANQTGTSGRRLLEGTIAIKRNDRDLLINDRIRLYLNDTIIEDPLDSIIVILEEENRANDDIKLIDAYLEKRDFNQAQLQINKVCQSGDPTGICDFKGIMSQFLQAQEGAFKMETDAQLKSEMESIAANNEKEYFLNAQALLQKVFNAPFQEEVLLPEGGKAQSTLEMPVEEITTAISRVYPNPAQDRISFEITLSGQTINNCHLKITDLVGRSCGKFPVIENGVPVSVNTETLVNGIYFYSVYNNENLIETKKFIINK